MIPRASKKFLNNFQAFEMRLSSFLAHVGFMEPTTKLITGEENWTNPKGSRK